jgi:UDP-N-acetylglucosamine 4,6-dehydratase
MSHIPEYSLADSMQALHGKTVLITGGTGSFGKAFVRSLLAYGNPQRIIIFSRDEQKHYRLQQEFPDKRLRFFIGDVRDRERLCTAFRGVHVVIHAAAMKHVPLCEYNPLEAIHTNINGATNVVSAALESDVERVIGISTDKAVAPANLYGATKLCMEKLLVAANSYAGSRKTRFSVVRYGNVMGSEGSVIPLFTKQRASGKLTITDTRMTRFWINMEGAIWLVMRALSLMQGGEVFIPKIPTTDILTLAEAMAPGVPTEVVGIRPGEKLHETLISAEECRRTYDIGDLYVIWPEFDFGGFLLQNPGRPVPEDFSYASDRTDLRLSLQKTREFLEKM